MAKKHKGKKSQKAARPADAADAVGAGGAGGPSTSAAHGADAVRPKGASGQDLVATAEQVFDRGDFSTTRKLLPKLRADGRPEAVREADKLWSLVKVDPVQLAIGLGAALVAALAALLTLA